jgi:peroxiredoxin
MSKQAANSIDPEILASNQSLPQQIAAFTTAAEKRLPPGYIDAFRALVARLVKEGLGRSAPEVGAAFPDFELRDDSGNSVRASDHWSRCTMIVKFYRGGWCPYCNLELRALQQRQQDFAALNAEVFAIAPEKSTAQAETKQKAGAGFKFLWDRDNALARQLGVSFPVEAAVKEIYGQLGLDLEEINGAWELPAPATFVVRDGRTRYRFIDPNYLERQDPLDLIAWLRADADLGHAGAPSHA